MSQLKEAAVAEMPRQRQVTFAGFWMLRLAPEWWRLERSRRSPAVAEAQEVLETAQQPELQLRAAYSLAAFRADCDLMLWWIASETDRMQEALHKLRQTEFGRHVELVDVYLGLAAGSQYTAEHQPAFLKGEAPRRYASVYPFAKTADWYLLPYEKRRDLMTEHGRVGLEYAVGTNTLQTFGLGDAEFIVALEADSLDELVRCVEALRKVEVRRYTRLETPIYLGRLRPLPELLQELA